MKKVITMDMIGKIRRMHRRDKKTQREISRKLGLSRNTVAKWLDEAQPVEPKYRREAAKATKLSAYEAELKQALKADAKRPKKERRTAKALFAQIKAAGYEGGYTRVTDFIRKWRQGEGQGAATNAFVPLTFEQGEAFQFDWSEDGLLVGGVYYRLQVSHMKLCASGAFWLVYPAQIVVVAGDAVVATHERLSDRNQTRYDWQHYVPLIERKPGALRNGAPFADLPEPLQRMRKALVHQEGGDKVMAQVLAEVPKQGLDAVLVAVELALESAPPSGRVSTEHVINVLGRLQAQPLPETVHTILQVSQTPLADTARYDSLRAASGVQEADHA